MPYEWDEKKNKLNIEKHFVDFEDAKKIFDDHNRIDAIDDRKDYGEVILISI